MMVKIVHEAFVGMHHMSYINDEKEKKYKLEDSKESAQLSFRAFIPSIIFVIHQPISKSK